MKFVPYRTFQGFDTKGILLMVASRADHQQGGAQSDEIRRRVRIQDALEACEKGPGLQLEDADHAFLKDKINVYPFAFANKDILQIIDDVNDAKAPPAVLMTAKDQAA